MKGLTLFLAFLMGWQSLNISVTDIAGMADLFEHAAYHNEKYGDDFVAFLAKHYGEQKKEHQKDHQEEKKEHDALPFQHHNGLNQISLAFHLPQLDWNTEVPKPKDSQKALIPYQFIYTPPEALGIFHPPKIV